MSQREIEKADLFYNSDVVNLQCINMHAKLNEMVSSGHASSNIEYTRTSKCMQN